jgi:hypothetical protein
VVNFLFGNNKHGKKNKTKQSNWRLSHVITYIIDDLKQVVENARFGIQKWWFYPTYFKMSSNGDVAMMTPYTYHLEMIL